MVNSTENHVSLGASDKAGVEVEVEVVKLLHALLPFQLILDLTPHASLLHTTVATPLALHALFRRCLAHTKFEVLSIGSISPAPTPRARYPVTALSALAKTTNLTCNRQKAKATPRDQGAGRDGEDRPREDTRSPEPEDKLKNATTLYVGNLSFYTTEEQIHELFSSTTQRVAIVFADIR